MGTAIFAQHVSITLAHGRFLFAQRKQFTFIFLLTTMTGFIHLCESFNLKATLQPVAHARVPQAWIWECGAVCLFMR